MAGKCKRSKRAVQRRAAQAGQNPVSAVAQAGENKFTRISWNDALDRIAKKIKGISPKQLAFFLTARGITNEVYYTAAKMARFLGTNNIDNASRICHSPSKTALKRSMGIGASSCNYQDWIGTDVLVFFGSVPANNQPVSTKYMYAAKKAGTKIILINPYKEPAMEQYWIPSVPESAVFGTKLADDFYQVNIGGDIAFMNGVMKHWFEMEQANPGSAINHEFVREHANGIEELRAHLQNQSWEALEKSSGVSKERLKEFALLLANSKSGVFVWSMGLTQHRFGTDNISSVANLAILRGFFGRKHCGVMPIRGHSGVQGSGEMGADPFSLPGGDFDEKAGRESRSCGIFRFRNGKAISSASRWKTPCCRMDTSARPDCFTRAGAIFWRRCPTLISCGRVWKVWSCASIRTLFSTRLRLWMPRKRSLCFRR